MLIQTMLVMCVMLPCALRAQSPAPACADDPNYALLDFWVGEWEVRSDSGELQGTNTIEKVLDGCAVTERWRGAGPSGGEGRSWFYYNNLTGVWRQIWVTSMAAALGGTKEKELIAVFEDGGTRFQGRLPLPDGGILLDRTTLIPSADGRVRQVIEMSQDGGTKWTTMFDAWYIRRPN